MCVRSRSGELPLDHLERVAEPAVDAEGGRRLVAGVDHAVLAARVLAVAVLVPGGLVHAGRRTSCGGCR